MDAVLAAMADPTRRLLLERLRAQGASSIGELGTGLPMTRQGVTKHLDMLRAAGLVTVHKVGRQQIHELDAEPLRAVEDWLRPYEEFWDARIAALRHHLGEDIE